MSALDRLLERAGSAGDLEAEALALVAVELRTLSAHMEDVKQAIIGKARAPGIDADRIAAAVVAALRASHVTIDVLPEKRQRKAG